MRRAVTSLLRVYMSNSDKPITEPPVASYGSFTLAVASCVQQARRVSARPTPLPRHAKGPGRGSRLPRLGRSYSEPLCP